MKTGDRLRAQWDRLTSGQREALPSILTVCPNDGCGHGIIDHDGDGPYVCEIDGCNCGAVASLGEDQA